MLPGTADPKTYSTILIIGLGEIRTFFLPHKYVQTLGIIISESNWGSADNTQRPRPLHLTHHPSIQINSTEGEISLITAEFTGVEQNNQKKN